MSSESGDGESIVAGHETGDAPTGVDGIDEVASSHESQRSDIEDGGQLVRGEDSPGLPPRPTGRSGQKLRALASRAENSDADPFSTLDESPPAESAGDSFVDDGASIQGSVNSSVGSTLPPSIGSSPRRNMSGARQPFERRFSSQLLSSPASSPRPRSPAFLTSHSRNSSVNSQLLANESDTEVSQPWEVVRWTKLKKLSGQVFSEIGKRNFGKPTCLAVSASIVVGTSKGFILVFDYQQVLKSIIGPGTKAIECGSVTALAISADHSTVAGGHATGHIFTWEIARPAKPFLHIPATDVVLLMERQIDGHVTGSAVLHIGFLGTRHTAIVSADDRGMAFSQLATRGLGVVGRAVKTTRILGRYPAKPGQFDQRKPSSVLAFSPLPLGNVEHATDSLGLTALLTPYLLVIVSTTPIAETQHKVARPKDITPHSAQSGCVAWFPSIRIKDQSTDSRNVSKPKLVYCWSNVLAVLEIDLVGIAQPDRAPELDFRLCGQKRLDEAIVAVQWLSRSVLAVLSISQRLVILEDVSLRITDSFDLLPRHIFHVDLFSRQLQPVIESLDENDASLHGVVADAFYMSFRAHKGRLFLLGFNDVSIGGLSNWADRLLALMENGDSVGAIKLATSYFTGESDKLTVGLPEDDEKRHDIVGDKISDMISATLDFHFKRIRNAGSQKTASATILELAETSFAACVSTKQLDFLFEDIYEKFRLVSATEIFLDVLEPYILDGMVNSLAPEVSKDLMAYAASRKEPSLEQMICQLRTETMDINQVTTICRENELYDALIYVWTEALDDYITPLIDLLIIADSRDDDASWDLAQRMFPFMACALTSRRYPGRALIADDDVSDKVKGDLYGFLFAGNHIEWPPGSGRVPLSDGPRRSYPYLRILLDFDTSSCMSMLNEAFEDHFLNGSPETVDTDRQASSSLTRQHIISILLELAGADDFDPTDRLYVHMFVARNLPKYPQFIILPGSVLQKSLVELCSYPSADIAEDCQLSVEYLLSIYQPPDMRALIPLLRRARFYNVLKSIYRSAGDWPALLQTYLEDPLDRDAIFDCISDCSRPGRGLSRKQIGEVLNVIVRCAPEIATIDAGRFAKILAAHSPEVLEKVFSTLENGSFQQYAFLRPLLEPDGPDAAPQTPRLPFGQAFAESYIRMMCKYNPSHVADYIGLLSSGDLHLDQVLPAMEQSGVIDAAVVLLARDGLVREAMDRLLKHLVTLETALSGLILASVDDPDASNSAETVEDLLEAVQKYWKVGIWLCQVQSKNQRAPPTQKQKIISKKQPIDDSESTLDADERLWLDLTEVIVNMAREINLAASTQQDTGSPTGDTLKTVSALRGHVQQTFTALLVSTSDSKSTTSNDPPSTAPSARRASFLHILRPLLNRLSASSPTLADLRLVLSDIFAAYTFEETILSLSNRFLDKDAFTQLNHVFTERRRGWRPLGQACEGCKRRVWGPGAGPHIWDAWREGLETEKQRREQRSRSGDQWERRGKVPSKEGPSKPILPIEQAVRRRTAMEVAVAGSSGSSSSDDDENDDDADTDHSQPRLRQQQNLGPVVIFACRHMFHRSCLEQIRGTSGAASSSARLTCPLCP